MWDTERESATPGSPSMWATLRRALFPHTVWLEDELSRTRSELTRWQNALLEARGLPSVAPSPPAKPFPPTKSRLLPSQWKAHMEALTKRKPEQEDGNAKAKAETKAAS